MTTPTPARLHCLTRSKTLLPRNTSYELPSTSAAAPLQPEESIADTAGQSTHDDDDNNDDYLAFRFPFRLPRRCLFVSVVGRSRCDGVFTRAKRVWRIIGRSFRFYKNAVTVVIDDVGIVVVGLANRYVFLPVILYSYLLFRIMFCCTLPSFHLSHLVLLNRSLPPLPTPT